MYMLLFDLPLIIIPFFHYFSRLLFNNRLFFMEHLAATAILHSVYTAPPACDSKAESCFTHRSPLLCAADSSLGQGAVLEFPMKICPKK